MNSITLQDLTQKAPALIQQLEKDQTLLVTNDSKPVALLFAADEESLDPCLKALHQVRRSGELTLKDINAIIAESRKARALPNG